MGQERCTLGSFYYNSKILVYGKMLLLKRHCLYSKHNSEFFSATVSPLLSDVAQTCLECPQKSELTVMAQRNTGFPAEGFWNANLLLNQSLDTCTFTLNMNTHLCNTLWKHTPSVHTLFFKTEQKDICSQHWIPVHHLKKRNFNEENFELQIETLQSNSQGYFIIVLK